MKKKSDELIELSEKDFSFVCPLKTVDMTAINGGYFCDSCEKKVHDVSSMTKDEYRQLLSKTENICVTFKKVATVSLALSLTACTSQKPIPELSGNVVDSYPNCNIEQNKTTINPLAPYKVLDINKSELSGDIVPIRPYVYESEAGGEPVQIEPLDDDFVIQKDTNK